GGISSVVYHLSNNELSRKRYRRSISQFPIEVRKLAAMCSGYPAELEALAKMTILFNQTTYYLQEANSKLEAGDRLGSTVPWTKMHRSLNELFIISDQIIQQQEVVQQERRLAQVQMRDQIKWLIIAGVAFNILLASGLAIYFNQG